MPEPMEAAVELPPVTDEYTAVPHLEGLLGDLGDDEPTQDTADTGAEEIQPTGDEEGHSDPAEPAIEPPKSWNADDKALFAELPRAQQEIVARRESERDASLARHVQESADRSKAIEAERAAFQSERQQALQTLQQLRLIAMPELQQFNGIDWARLSAENPAEYVRLSGARDQLLGRVNMLTQAAQQVEQQQQALRSQQQTEYLNQQRTLLHEREPVFADEVKGAALAKELGGWLENQGFTRDEIGQTADHRLILLGLKAMRAEQVENARKTAEVKKANPAPRVQAPGSTAPEDRGNRQARESMQRLRQSGDVRDAGRLMEQFIS